MVEVDGHKLMYHPERVAEWKEGGNCIAPVYIEIGLTERCNNKCVFCALDWLEDGKNDIDRGVMLSALEDMASSGVKSVMFAGEGEPTLHKHFDEFVITAKTAGIDVSTTTNGLKFDKEMSEKCLPHLSWMRFSVDAGTAETYSKVHGTKKENFYKVLKNIEDAANVNSGRGYDTVIGVQFLMIKQSLNEVSKLAELVRDAGANNLQVKPYSQHPLSDNKLFVSPSDYAHVGPELEKYNSGEFQISFREETMKRLEQGVNYNACHGLSFSSLVDSKGNIFPCNMFYGDKEFHYGNLHEKSFSEIWSGEKRKDVLAKLNDGGLSGCRKACRLDAMNRYLHRVKNPEPHDNFV